MSAPIHQHELSDKWDDYFDQYATEEIQEVIETLEKDEYLDTVPLKIDFETVSEFDADFAHDLQNAPRDVFSAATQALEGRDEFVESPDLPVNPVEFRIQNLPKIRIREITHEYLGSLVSVDGIVQQATDPQPRFVELAFECLRCGTITRIRQSNDSLSEPHECQGCERQGPFRTDMRQTKHIHHQRLRVQESPEGLRGGKDPRSVDIHLEGDLVDLAAPGDQVTVTGRLTYPDPASTGDDDPLAQPYLIANNVETETDAFTVSNISDEDEKKIIEYANGDNPLKKVVNSIAPSIFGYQKEKTAIALQMFSGAQKPVEDKTIRGDIHVFLVGDPGTAKSQLLHFVNDIMPRSSYTTGEGSSKVGLTGAAVQSDLGDGSWTVEAGVLVLSDQGIACVDELDKLEEGTDALHSALEQQQVNIAKAGINTTMNARCGLLAAANPKYGRWEPYEPVPEQVDLPPAIVSRFDLIFVLRDEPDRDFDSQLAESVLDTNHAGQQLSAGTEPDDVEELQEPEIPLDLLQKYIMYARETVNPQLTDEAKTKLQEFYVDMRDTNSGDDGAISITARKLEASIRLAEASARVRLSDKITESDAELALDMIKESLSKVGIDPETGELDADAIETGTTKTQRDRIYTLKDVIETVEDEHDDGAPVEVVKETALEHGIEESDFEHELSKMKQKGEVYEPRSGHLRTT